MLAATKFSDDFSLSVDVFATLGGIPSREMSQLELHFCSLAGFNFHVSEDEFEHKCMRNLEAAFEIASSRINKRNISQLPPRVTIASQITSGTGKWAPPVSQDNETRDIQAQPSDGSISSDDTSFKCQK
mmetsp:Transcript_23163/g.43209  ORF Transcript_23163/g.43209 Transcript_23163/m.43209 type:complete len:129 (-) Transcript_23163:67-453(-)